jgi:predicted DNA binding CopG/RHH family protein
MNQESEFPFDRARRVTPEENQKFRAAVSAQLKLKKRSLPSKDEDDKYEPVSIRLHPRILVWAKEEAAKQGIGYQTVINELLLSQIEP